MRVLMRKVHVLRPILGALLPLILVPSSMPAMAAADTEPAGYCAEPPAVSVDREASMAPPEAEEAKLDEAPSPSLREMLVDARVAHEAKDEAEQPVPPAPVKKSHKKAWTIVGIVLGAAVVAAVAGGGGGGGGGVGY